MNYYPSRGFTLIELIVSIGLFVIVSTMAAGGYLITISVARHSEVLVAGVDNLSFALETMMREIRTGSNYRCNGVAQPCSGGTSLIVRDIDGVTDYTFATDGDHVTMGAIIENTLQITDPAVIVQSLTFYVTGPLGNDVQQARVTVVVTGLIIADPGKQVPFSIQTGATMRALSP